MNQRLEFIDASRGLAIFTVVYSHICLFCLPDYESSAVIDFLRIYFLNAFFFISGLFSYRRICNFNECVKLSWKRIYQFLIPTVLIGLIYAFSHGISPYALFYNDAKHGYWFTISLFEMFIIYYVFATISYKFVREDISAIIFTIVCFLMYFTFKAYPINREVSSLLCWDSTIYYIPLYAIGILCNTHKPLFIKLLHTKGGIC